MATEAIICELTLTAENSFSGKQFYAAEISGNNQCDVCDGTGDLVVGIIQNEPGASGAAKVAVMGKTKWLAGGTVTAGNRVGTDASGKCVAKTADADLVAGIAITGGVSGDIIEVLLSPNAQRAS